MRRLFALSLALCMLLASAAPAVAGDTGAKQARDRSIVSPLAAPTPMRATAQEADDDIPGVDATASPLAGTLAKTSDPDDVWSIYLAEGETLSVDLRGESGTDFDVYLFGPGTSTVYTLDGPLKEAATASYPETLSFAVSTSGTYYIDAYSYEGSGSYTLHYATAPTQPSVSRPDDDIPGVAAPRGGIADSLDVTADHDDVFALRLHAGDKISARITGAEQTDFDLYLYGPSTDTVVDSTEWLVCAAGDKYPDSFTHAVRTTGTYYLDAWAYSGSGAYTLSYSVKRRPFVGSPVAPNKVRRAARFRVHGTIRPAHPAGSRPVRIYLWKRIRPGVWKRHGYVIAQAKDYAGATRYHGRVRLPHRGKWRLRAYAAEDASHTAAWSKGYTYVTVR